MVFRLNYPTITNNTWAQVQGTRLVPRSVLTSNTSNAVLTSSRTITSHSNFHVGVGLDVSGTPSAASAVHPGWRRAATTLVVAANWDYEQAFADKRGAGDARHRAV